jgi:hypothetical protein
MTMPSDFDCSNQSGLFSNQIDNRLKALPREGLGNARKYFSKHNTFTDFFLLCNLDRLSTIEREIKNQQPIVMRLS